MANQTELLNVSDEMKLDDERQSFEGLECGEGLCSSSSDTTEELYSSSAPDTCGDCSVAHKSELIEILEFTHFFEHFTFDKTDYSERGKHTKKYIRVVVAVELVTVGAKIEPTS